MTALFATSAAKCGDDLTRTCLHDAAKKETAWTGGDLHAPVNLAQHGTPLTLADVGKSMSDVK